MTIASISLSITNPWPVPPAASSARPAQAVGNEGPTSRARACGELAECEAPRRSPLYRALVDALESLTADMTRSTPAAAPVSDPAQAAASTNAQVPAPAATAPPSDAANSAPSAPKLEDALMDFARALMLTLRGDEGDDDGRRRGHHRPHHDHGCRAWGDPVQRIEQLGARLSPAAPAGPHPTRPTPAVDNSAASTPVAQGPASPSETTAPAATPAAPPVGVTRLDVTINFAPAQGWRRLGGEGLLDAFGALQQALGQPAPSGASLQSQLVGFLRALADKLRHNDASSPDLATQPGALLNLSA